jgi:hypothetical protein
VTLAVTLTALLATAGPAPAATPAVTAQAQATNAALLGYAPAPAAGAGALCLIDTGVNANPDTQPELVSASAIDGGSGNDVDPDGHGTTMAMIAGAAGHAMIGAWPQIKIVSVRATNTPNPGQEPTFEFDDYWQGISRCSTLASTYHIHAIDLALSSTIPPSPTRPATSPIRSRKRTDKTWRCLRRRATNQGPLKSPQRSPACSRSALQRPTRTR